MLFVSFHKKWFAFGILAVTVTAAPIRVAIFKGTGGGGDSWHDNIHTASAAVISILANPAAADLGANLVVPADGFVVSEYGTTTGTTKPTAPQIAAFMAALDSVQVVVIPSLTDIGAVLTGADRVKLETFAQTKGLVSLHFTIDHKSRWAEWTALHGATFRNHPMTDRSGTVYLDTLAKNDPNWKLLNRGLPDTARFTEEWVFFVEAPAAIRGHPQLKVTVNLNEASVESGLGGIAAMGDHPLSWYRELPGGGRFFYTALGHRPQHYTGMSSGSNPGTHYIRRQIYNAIVWAARRDSLGNPVTVAPAAREPVAPQITIRALDSKLVVDVSEPGSYTVEVLTPNGKRTAMRRGFGTGRFAFSGLSAGSVYMVRVKTRHETHTKLALP